MWSTLFSDSPANPQTNEGLTMVLYDYSQRQINPLYSLFSSEPACEYYMKPTSVMTSRFSTRADYQLSGSQVAADPRNNPVTYTTSMGESVVNKYNYIRSIQSQDAPIYIYRAAEIHLMIAEALTALGTTRPPMPLSTTDSSLTGLRATATIRRSMRRSMLMRN